MRKWNLQETRETTYREPAHIVSLVFTDRLNTEYYVQKDEPKDLGENPTYKDYIARALDPNTEHNSNVYGIAKQLKPLGARIADVKATIDAANYALADYEQRKMEMENQPAPVNDPAPAPAPAPTQGDVKND